MMLTAQRGILLIVSFLWGCVAVATVDELDTGAPYVDHIDPRLNGCAVDVDDGRTFAACSVVASSTEAGASCSELGGGLVVVDVAGDPLLAHVGADGLDPAGLDAGGGWWIGGCRAMRPDGTVEATGCDEVRFYICELAP